MLNDITEEQLVEIKNDPSTTLLEEKDKTMLLFVLKSVKTPDTVEQDDIDSLKEMGWTEKDIFEATHHGADMVRHGILFKAFKMESL